MQSPNPCCECCGRRACKPSDPSPCPRVAAHLQPPTSLGLMPLEVCFARRLLNPQLNRLAAAGSVKGTLLSALFEGSSGCDIGFLAKAKAACRAAQVKFPSRCHFRPLNPECSEAQSEPASDESRDPNVTAYPGPKQPVCAATSKAWAFVETFADVLWPVADSPSRDLLQRRQGASGFIRML